VNGRDRTAYLIRDRASDITDRAQLSSSRIGGTSAANVDNADSVADNDRPVSRENARAAAKGAWWTLFSLVLGLAASAIGGYSGGRMDHDSERRTRSHDSVTDTPGSER
jgi:hypothetical protein